jgi:hypothetical protein
MQRFKWWAGLGIVALLLSATTASAQQGCEYTTSIDFFDSAIMINADCRWSDSRELYECRRQGAPAWDLMISSPEPGFGRTVAYRDDGFAVIYGCSCGGNCSFYSPAPLSGRAEPVEPGNWLCTGDAARYNAFSGDLWGVSCFSPNGGMYAQVQGYTEYSNGHSQGNSTMWLFVFNGNDGDPGCRGQLNCSATFQEPGGPPRQYNRAPGEYGLQLDYIVESVQLQCFCE